MNINDPCDGATLTTTTQTSPASDAYTGNDIIYTLTPFTIAPSTCSVAYTCDSVVRQDGEDASYPDSLLNCDYFEKNGLFNDDASGTASTLIGVAIESFYKNGSAPPGVYVVTIKGKAVNLAEDGEEKTETFTVTLVDPCNPPEITVPSPFTQPDPYTLTDSKKEFTHDAFTQDSTFCPPIKYTYELGTVGAVTAPAGQDRDLSILYQSGLDILDQT